MISFVCLVVVNHKLRHKHIRIEPRLTQDAPVAKFLNSVCLTSFGSSNDLSRWQCHTGDSGICFFYHFCQMRFCTCLFNCVCALWEVCAHKYTHAHTSRPHNAINAYSFVCLFPSMYEWNTCEFKFFHVSDHASI